MTLSDVYGALTSAAEANRPPPTILVALRWWPVQRTARQVRDDSPDPRRENYATVIRLSACI
jgi:hypothetical protein